MRNSAARKTLSAAIATQTPIHANYKEDISLPVVATALGYSTSYVTKHFRSCFPHYD